MPTDVLTEFAWIVWLGLILIFLIIEVSTLEFTFLMIALGSLGGLVSGLFGLPWWAQILVAAALALVLLARCVPRCCGCSSAAATRVEPSSTPCSASRAR